MKRLAALLAVLVGCSSLPKSHEQSEFVSELQKAAPNVAAKAIAQPVKAMAKGAVDAVQVGKLVGMSPTTNDAYLGWVKSSVGFQKGEITEDKLQSLGIDLPYNWRVLKKWDDGSVRIGQFKTVGYFNGYGVSPVYLDWGKTPQAFFSWHPEVWAAVASNRFGNNLKVQAIANGVPVDCIPASGAWKFLVADATEIVVRFRSHCFNRATGEPHPLSMTSYWTLHSQDPVVRTDLILGNDQLEQPIHGGISVSGVSLSTGNLPQVRWVNEASYGNKTVQLADGQTMAWKIVTALDPAFNSTANMIATGEPMGFQLWQDIVKSNAFMTAPMPPTRVPPNEIQQVHLQVNAEASFPNGQAQDWYGVVLKRPPDTGAQVDFASGMPMNLQKAAQAYSSRQMASMLLAGYRESYRGSFLWDGNDRFNVLSDQTLFCWSGKCPHYDWSWQQGVRQVWFARTRNAGFDGGYSSGWETYDHQHVSMNSLRAIYELTGSALVEDWLKYQVTMFAVGYFASPWATALEADRAFGRSVKEAIAMTELFPELPETGILKQRIAVKQQAQRDNVAANIARFGHIGGILTDGCLPSVALGCELQQQLGQGPIVNRGWQTGFIQEAELLDPNSNLKWLEYSHEMFLADGTPKTDHLIADPNQYRTGGIGIEWWAGYVTLALKNPRAPGAQFVLEKVKPVLDARFQHGCGFPSPYFCLNDAWKNW